MSVNIKNKKKKIVDILEHAWLNLSDEEISHAIIHDPFKPTNRDEADNPHIKLLRLLREPEYFWLTCKYIFNLDLLPFQVLILQQLWKYSFPMLIATRGGGKCITGDSLIITNTGIKEIQQIVNDEPVYQRQYFNNVHLHGENQFSMADYGWCNGTTETIKLCTKFGYELEGTLNHPIRTVRNGEIVWLELKDLKLGDNVVIQRNSEWFDETNDLTEDHGYFFGLIIGDGGYTIRGRITFTTANKELFEEINRISLKLFNKPFKKQQYKYDWLLCGVDIWDSLFQQYGFNSPVCAEKDFPTSILSAKKSVMAAFIRGLMDTDGCFSGSKLEFCSKSKNLVYKLQFILLLFGIISKVKKRLNTKYNTYYYYLYIRNYENIKKYYIEIGFGLSQKQDKLANFVKNKTKSNPNVGVIPRELILPLLLRLLNKWIKVRPPVPHNYCYEYRLFSKSRLEKYDISYTTLSKILNICQVLHDEPEWQSLDDIKNKNYFYDEIEILQSSCNKTYDVFIPGDHSFISNGFISHNTFILAVYALLRALLTPSSKIVGVAASFRQSKFIFEYCEQIYKEAPVLRDLIGGDANLGRVRYGIKRNIDRVEILLGNSQIIFIPIGDGCLGPNSLIETNKGLIRIKEYNNYKNLKVYNGFTSYDNPTDYIITQPISTYRITLENGLTLDCSHIHKLYTSNGWQYGRDLKSGDLLLFDMTDYFPKDYVKCDDVIVDENLAWILGLLVSEGSVKDKYRLDITMTDKDCILQLLDTWLQVDNKLNPKYSERKEYIDKRGWNCKRRYSCRLTNLVLREKLAKLGLGYCTAHDKSIPWSILQSPKSVISAFLRGLYHGDGCCSLKPLKYGFNYLDIRYTTVSEQLIQEVQILLLKLGIQSHRYQKTGGVNHSSIWELCVCGDNAFDLYNLINVDRWQHFKKDLRPSPIKFSVDYKKKQRKWRARIKVRNKEHHLGMFRTRQEAINSYINAQAYYSKYTAVKSVELLPDLYELYDFSMPDWNSFVANGIVNHNSKVRGMRATHLIADEFSSIPIDVFEIVISGFAATSANPILKVKELARQKKLVEFGVTNASSLIAGNQVILSGTAYYDFNHFASYWKRYRQIILSKGDPTKLTQIFDGQIPENFDWRDYCIIRLPHELIPNGFMDSKQLARAKATVHSGVFQTEYGSVFVTDSHGFFKRSLIESCVCTKIKDHPDGDVIFHAMILGNPTRKYVYAIDPASERDNCALVILEIHPNHRRVVYCWTITRLKHREKVQRGLVTEQDYYAYIGRKIRDLMKTFPCELIAMDSQGGGIAVSESLHDPDKLHGSEQPIWSTVDADKKKPTDDLPGLHILEMVNFAKADWVMEANHGLKKDFEDKICIFPYFDPLTVEYAAVEDENENCLYDTLEDCVLEIEELKDELASIVHDQTQQGRDKWTLPEIRLAQNKKSVIRKDRYTALLMANMIARTIYRHDLFFQPAQYPAVGGFTHSLLRQSVPSERLYSGPTWFTDAVNGGYGVSVNR